MYNLSRETQYSIILLICEKMAKLHPQPVAAVELSQEGKSLISQQSYVLCL